MPFYNSEEKGRPIKIKDEGLTLVNNVASIDLVGDGVLASSLGDDVTQNIPGTGTTDWLLNGNTLGSKKTLGSIDNYDIGFITNNTERLTILNDGNVGIGTTNPTQKLLVNDGNIHINTPNSSVSGNGLRLNRPGATYAGFEIATNNIVDWSIGANSQGFGIYEDGVAATTRLIIKDGGNVGIGTTNPWAKLSSYGTAQGGVFDALEVKNEATSAAGNGVRIILSPQSNYYPADKGGYIEADFDSATSRVKLKLGARIAGDILTLDGNNGNVGIGTTNPTNQLTVKNSNQNMGVNVGDIGSSGYAGIGFSNSTTDSSNYNLMGNGTSIWFNRASGGNINFREANGTNQLTILSGGNVGIGTTNPGDKLDISGSMRITASSGSYLDRYAKFTQSGNDSSPLSLSFGGTGTASYLDIQQSHPYYGFLMHKGSVWGGQGIQGTNNDFVISTGTTTQDIVFNGGNFRSANEIMRLKGTGNVGVGTTTPGAKLDVKGTSRFGDSATNYLSISSTGTLTLNGSATVFDDEKADALSLKQSGSGVSSNSTENTVDFTTGANLSDYLYTNVQLGHSWKVGSVIYPHIHFFQTTSSMPNLLIQYRWQKNGGTKETSWTNYKCNTAAFTYTSGVIHQIAHDSGITPPSGSGLSDIIQFRILRDNANTSGVFTGTDPVGATVGIISFDVHIEKDTLGSESEYTK